MKTLRLRNKLLLGALLISVLLTLISMLAIFWVASQQYREQANELLGKATGTIENQLTELKHNQSHVAHQLATQQGFVSTLWYLSKYQQSGVEPEMLLLTHLQLVKEINKLSRAQQFATVTVYGSDGHLIAFVRDNEGGHRAGFAAADHRLQGATLKAGEELNRDNVQGLPAIDGFGMQGILPQQDSVRYVLVDGMPAIETQTRVQGAVPDAAGEVMRTATVGLLVTVQPLRRDFADQLSKLTHTRINLFTPQGFSAGELPAYPRMTPEEWDDKKDRLFKEIEVGGERYFQALTVLRDGERRVGAVVALHSEQLVQKNIREMLGTLLVIALASLLLIFPVVRYFANAMARPLTTLSQLFREVAAGQDDGEVKAQLKKLEQTQHGDDEMGDLTRSFVLMAQAVSQKMRQIKELNACLEEKVNQRTHELRVANEALTRLAMHDALTGLPNRQLLGDRLTHALIAAQRDHARVALMFIDLDEFKPVNDQHGHAVGDWLLQEAASRIQQCVRASDTVSRIGGDEFVVLLPVVEAVHDAVEVAEKIGQSLLQPFESKELSLHISASIGVALYPDHAGNESELFRQADVAMYQAKNRGRNRVCRFEPPGESAGVC